MVSKETLEEIKYYSEHPCNEKTAKDMFEELGYKLWKGYCKDIIVYEKEDRCIRFNLTDTCYLDEKTISIFHPLDESVYEQEVVLTLNELKAINKQVEELRW